MPAGRANRAAAALLAVATLATGCSGDRGSAPPVTPSTSVATEATSAVQVRPTEPARSPASTPPAPGTPAVTAPSIPVTATLPPLPTVTLPSTPSAPTLPVNTAPDGEPVGVQTITDLHDEVVDGPVAYPELPPAGGNHAASWQNCGFYDMPVTNEVAVHSLARGAVWITYDPEVGDEELGTLQALVPGNPQLLVTPFTQEPLPAPIVATAWARQLTFDSAADPLLAAFVTYFQGGEQAPQHGQPCTGGSGMPAVAP